MTSHAFIKTKFAENAQGGSQAFFTQFALSFDIDALFRHHGFRHIGIHYDTVHCF
jgi:hypothetical protein